MYFFLNFFERFKWKKNKVNFCLIWLGKGSLYRESEIYEDEWNVEDRGGNEVWVFREECMF